MQASPVGHQAAPAPLGRPKRLIFCFDGTWNRLDAATPTNVVLTAESVLPTARDGTAQAIFYDEGVGTRRFERLTGGMFGAGLVENLGDAYRFLTFNYTPGDEIYVFGFSRGAFTARSFVGLLHNCGIVARSQAGRINEAIQLYRQRTANSHPDSARVHALRAELSPSVCVDAAEDSWRCANLPGYVAGSAPVLQVRYLGVWDTVGALGVPARYRVFKRADATTAFHDTTLTSMVRAGRHAVAIDERRQDFQPTLWTGLDELNRQAGFDPDAPDAPYLQQWFPGVHCAVGGGGDFRGLSDQALGWIWDGARLAGLDLDTDRSSRIYGLAPDPASPLSPFDETRLKGLERLKAKALDAIWRRGDRTGPDRLRDVAVSARRRWAMPAADLPEKSVYRPVPLASVARVLDASPPPPPAVPPGTFETIIVQPGDALRAIAQRLYGHADRAGEIFAMNRDKLDDPDHIYAGMSLKVPIKP